MQGDQVRDLREDGVLEELLEGSLESGMGQKWQNKWLGEHGNSKAVEPEGISEGLLCMRSVWLIHILRDPVQEIQI